MPIDFVKQIHEDLAISEPNLTFFIDISPELSKARISDRESDRMESESTEFFAKVRQGYIASAKDTERVVTIDGQKSIEEIFAQIKDEIIKRMNVSLE